MIFAITFILASLSLAQPVADQPDKSQLPKCSEKQIVPFSDLGCLEGKEKDAGLCYKPCREGYKGVGPVCWKGLKSYGRGVGTPMTPICSGGPVFQEPSEEPGFDIFKQHQTAKED